MEFWGVEVKVGQSVKVEPGVECIIHLSQACLVDVKKGNEKDTVYLYVNTENQKLCIGTLSADKFPQIGFDLVFGKEFQISHTSKTGSVHLCGYKTILSEWATFDSEDIAKATLNEANTGNITIKEQNNEEALLPSRQQNLNSDDSSDSLDSSDDEDTPIALKAISEKDDDSDDEDDSEDCDEDDSDDYDEENNDTQNKPIQNNKRENDSVEVRAPAKKAKLVTPEKIDAKKSGGHVATPYPTKQLVKGAGNSDKSKQQSQKTGEFRCNSCNRNFGSENALQSHSKAKHG